MSAVTLTAWCAANPHGAATEIERLRTMLRELIDCAWEERFEDRHTVDSEIIGKIAAYLVAVKAKEG